VAFFVVPSAVALAALGDVIAGAILQSGRFSEADTRWVWGVLAGASVGLVAGTMGRLYNSAWYALHDTRTPVRYAFVRVIAAAVLGGSAALWGPAALGLPAKWGVAGITAGAGIAAWIEFALLRRALMARIGSVSLPPGLLARLWGAAVGGAAAGYATKLALAAASPVVVAATALPVMGLVYVASARALGVAEVDTFLARLRSRARRADGAG
jgi:putative peptidoglycan lipid II flippase